MRGARVRVAASPAVEGALLAVAPAALVVCALAQPDQSAAVGAVAVTASLAALYLAFDRSRPPLRQLMPVVVLTAAAVAGRVLFAPLPDVKPVSAIAVLAGVVFGRRCGFMTGSLAALLSNFFFGQGLWTPWQMYSWGLVGYAAGVLGQAGLLSRTWQVSAYGLVSGLLFGLVMNGFYVVGFVHPVTWPAILAAYAAGLPFDLVHGLSTAAFLLAAWAPWKERLEHAKRKYALLRV